MGEPYQVKTTCPAEPAAIAGSTDVRVSPLLFTRMGFDHVGEAAVFASSDTQ